MKTLELNQMEKLNGGHTSPGQCAAMAIASVVIGAFFLPAGISMAVGTGIACGGSL